MKLEALKVKNWCDEKLSSVAWQRIAVKVSPEFRGSGIKLTQLLNPDASILLDDKQYAIIKQAIEDTYEVSISIMV